MHINFSFIASAPIQPENKKKEGQNSINYMIRQLIQQSRENTSKINKMHSEMMGRIDHDPEETVQQPAGQRDFVLNRKFSVFSTVSENVAVFGCFDVTTVQSNMLDENPSTSNMRAFERSNIIQTAPAGEEMPSKIRSRRKSVVRPGKHPRIRDIDEENDCFDDDCEIYISRPGCSNWDNDEDAGYRRNRTVDFRRSSTISFAYPLFPANPRTTRFIYPDWRTESNGGSLSL